jgi:hypothetical protein
MMTSEKEWLDECVFKELRGQASPKVLPKALNMYDESLRKRNAYKPYFRLLQFFVMLLIQALSFFYDLVGELFSLFGFLPRTRRSHEKFTGYFTATMLMLSLTYISLDNR